MIVVDASVVANAVADDSGDGRRARMEIRSARYVAAPDLVDVETAAVLRRRWLAGAISEPRFASAIGDLEALDMDRYPTLPLLRRVFDLRSNVTAYDATCVALAEALRCDLLTGDARLANAAGPHCIIRLLP